MGIRHGDSPCKKSKTNRPCIFKHHNSTPIGEGIVKQIWGCRRCGKNEIEDIKVGSVECSTSPSLKHKWKVERQIAFQQHYRHREISEIQSCDCCGAVREYHYQSMVGYNPHNKN